MFEDKASENIESNKSFRGCIFIIWILDKMTKNNNKMK